MVRAAPLSTDFRSSGAPGILELKRLVGFSLISFCLVAITGSAPADQFDSGLIPSPHILMPDGAPSSTVFLFSDKQGWSAADEDFAGRLASDGSIVVGVDLPQYLQSIDKVDDDCAYLVSDIEGLSQQMQRASGSSNYNPPILAGKGEGGGLVMAIAAQTPAATVGHSVAVDPTATLPLTKTLCSGAARKVTPQGTVYDLEKGELPNPIDIAFTSAASADGRAHMEDLRSQGFDLKVSDSAIPARAALEKAVGSALQEQDDTSDIPLVELPATPAHDTMAIIYSGDGGWRDLDKSIGGILQQKGIPTIGVDSLRYFWSQRPAKDVAGDLKQMIAKYTDLWKVKHVLLIGYSFGADVLPATYNALDEADRQRISQISLLGFSPDASFEVSVAGWLGTADSDSTPTLPDLDKIDPKLVQCFYGEDEDDTACPKLVGKPIEIIKTSGGHHFDGDYDALADKILDGLLRRIGMAANTTP
jgi:type IV secretory pathway VirJ component